MKQWCKTQLLIGPCMNFDTLCNGVTACVTRLVTLMVCTLGVVILERAMLYQNVGSNGREQ